jgi:hypothetical protein
MLFCRLTSLMNGNGCQIQRNCIQFMMHIWSHLVQLRLRGISIVTSFGTSLLRLKFQLLRGPFFVTGYLRSTTYLFVGAFVTTLFCARADVMMWRMVTIYFLNVLSLVSYGMVLFCGYWFSAFFLIMLQLSHPIFVECTNFANHPGIIFK